MQQVPTQGHAPGAGERPRPKRLGDDALMRSILPVGRSGLAIAAGYLGIFSLIPIFGPIAILVGVLAIRDLKAHPDKYGMGRAIFGIVAGAIATLFVLMMIFAVATR
ncbi:MAG: hypothetical protein ABI134_01325 [Byssovorax sp.]